MPLRMHVDALAQNQLTIKLCDEELSPLYVCHVAKSKRKAYTHTHPSNGKLSI